MYKTIAQISIFQVMENEDFGDLRRLMILFEHLPAEHLINILNHERKNGRDDFTNEAMLRMFLVKFVFQLDTVEELRRELLRNPTLRKICLLNDTERKLHKFIKDGKVYTGKIVPGANVFTGFTKRLMKHQDELEEIFNVLRSQIYTCDDNFGKGVAGDGKYFDSYAKCDKSNNCNDGRSENDAKWSTKEYHYKDAKGEMKVKKEHHYGFRKHTLVDVKTELPIASAILPANSDEKKVMKTLFETLPKEIRERIDYSTFDRGYDSTEFLNVIRGYGIHPVIDKRNMRKGDKLIQYRRNKNIYYTEAGEVYYYDETIDDERIDTETGQKRYFQKMYYEGYDKNRKAMRYSYKNHTYRLYIKDEPRIFNEIARESNKFKKYYNSRTGVERYHGRLDRDLRFEKHTIRGLKKMRMYTTIADIVMLAFGIAHYKLGQTNIASMYNF